MQHGLDEAAQRRRPRRSDHAYHPLRLLVAGLAHEAAKGQGPTLDLGCGSKPYASLLPVPALGLDVQHVHGRPDVVGTSEFLPVASGSIGTVLSTQQLEHVDDPAQVLAEARRVLRPGGLLLLSTHGVWAHHPDPHDLWRWTEDGLARLISSCGFAVQRTHRMGGPVLAGALLASYPLAGVARSSTTSRHLARAALYVVNRIAWPLDVVVEGRAPRHYGSTGYLVVALAT